MFKQQKGITLVALVVTIIVLLILAGVSISLVLGQNGVLTQASTAVSKTNIAKVKEEVNLALSSMEADYYTAWATDTGVSREKHYTEGNLDTYLSGEVTYTLSTTLNASVSPEKVVKDTTVSTTKALAKDVGYVVVYSGVRYVITFEENAGVLSLKGEPTVTEAEDA